MAAYDQLWTEPARAAGALRRPGSAGIHIWGAAAVLTFVRLVMEKDEWNSSIWARARVTVAVTYGVWDLGFISF